MRNSKQPSETQSGPIQPTSLWKVILLSVFSANFIIGTSLLIASEISWGLAVISSVLWGLLAVASSTILKEWSLSWAALIAIIGSLLGGMYMAEYADLQDRMIIHHVSLEEAAQSPEAAGYTFKEGFVKTDFGVTYRKSHTDSKGRTSITRYYAAPVITKNWDPSRPVKIFAVGETTADTKTWSDPLRGGIRAPITYMKELRAAVDLCIQTHRLIQSDELIMIKWVQSPYQAIKKKKKDLWDTLLIWNIILLAGIFSFRIISFIKKKGKTKSLQPSTEASKLRLSKDVIFRILFSFLNFYILIFSLYFSGFDFSSLIPLILLVIALVFYIISHATLQIAHKKDQRPIHDLVFLSVYPFIVYLITFQKLELSQPHIWIFAGFFLFFLITGGFIFGILSSPLMNRRNDLSRLTGRKHTGEKGHIQRRGGVKFSLFLLFGGILLVLTVVFIQLIKPLQPLSPLRIFSFYLFLISGTALTVKFTRRHSIYNLRQDLDLQKKYK